MYYIFIENGKISGCGQCRMLNDDIENLEVSEDVYKSYSATPNKYVYLNGKLAENPEYEAEEAQKERNRLDMLSLTKREVFLALYKAKGLTPEQIRASITDPEALIEFDYANEYYRGNPLINAIGEQLGYSVDELDYLFENKKLPEKMVEENNSTGEASDETSSNPPVNNNEVEE